MQPGIDTTTPLDDRQMLHSVYLTVLMAFLLPPFAGGTIMTLMGFYPFPEFLWVFPNYSGAYILITLSLVLLQVPRMHRSLVSLGCMEPAQAEVRAKRLFHAISFHVPIIVTVYSSIGVISADFSLQRLGYLQLTLQQHLYNQLGLIPVVLITWLPIFFFLIDRIGRYLAPRGIEMVAVPLWAKLLMLGIVTPVLIDCVLVGYFYNRTGFMSVDTLVLWLSLMAIAAGGTWLAWKSFSQSITPLQSFLAIHATDDIGEQTADLRLRALSLDELGVLTAKFAGLIEARQSLANDLEDQRDYATNLVNTAPVIVLILNKQGHIEFVNPWFERLSGYSLEEIRGKEWFSTMLPTHDRNTIRKLFQRATRDERVRGNINPIVTRNGELRQIEWYDNPICNKDGLSDRLLVIGQDVTARLNSEQKLRQSRTQLNEAQRIARVGSWELDTLNNRMVGSEELFRIVEIDPNTFNGSHDEFVARMHPQDREMVRRIYELKRESYRVDYRLLMPDGRTKWISEYGENSFTDEGEPLRSIGVVQDVTERVLIEQQLQASLRDKETLLREVHHRVKNNLQIISSLLHFQAKKAVTPEAITTLQEGQDRLRAMTLVHEKLYQTQDLAHIEIGDYLRTLTNQILKNYLDRPSAIHSDLELCSVYLTTEQALPLGMITCEVLTNLFKYAFPDGSDGHFSVRLEVIGDTLSLRIADDGVGLPEDFDPAESGGFGMRLIHNLCAQLGARLLFSGPPGTCVSIEVPLAGKQA